METYDVAIVGGGVIGLSTGYWLAKRGLSVLVLEKGRVAYEASSRATGYQSMRGENPPEIPLAAEANRLWMTLEDELGYPTEWQSSGRMWVTLDATELGDFHKSCEVWRSHDLPIRAIDVDEARRLVPVLSPMIAGALYTQRGGHANPQRTSQAFAWALLDRGGNIRENTPVLGIEVSHGKASGVRTADGIISAGAVVVCAGPQVALLCRPLGITVPVAAARLEGFVSTPLPPQFDVALVGNGLSVRQTRRGNIHFSGGPHEWINVELASEPPKPSTAIVRGAARRLLELFPTFENAALLRCWAGVVEVTPDHACLIENRALDGLVIASASGHGIGLSPALGKAISELVTDRRSSIPIDGLGLDRFNELDPNWANERRWVAGEYNT